MINCEYDNYNRFLAIFHCPFSVYRGLGAGARGNREGGIVSERTRKKKTRVIISKFILIGSDNERFTKKKKRR